MPETIADLLNLDLAWSRVKADLASRVFVKHPYQVDLIELDLQGWLQSIRSDLQNGRYSPQPISSCDVPKENGAVRPGCIMSLSDQLVYTACIGACFGFIHRVVSWANEVVDFSFRFSNDQNAVGWLRNPFEGWQLFREKSLAKIKQQGIAYVVITDISGYFENIDIKTLMADLRQTEAPPEVIEQIFRCFDRWSIVKGRGLPQGLSPSSVLGKLYLNSIDQNLRDNGFDHYRYVDDIRIFCKSKAQAKKAMLFLIQLLRDRGLTIQPSKTLILRSDEAIDEISGIEPILESVRNRFVEQIKADSGRASSAYMTFEEAEKLYNERPEIFSAQVLSETYRIYFIESPDKQFDKTLFRFLLHRLGKKSDRCALESCLPFLEKHPGETKDILNYLAAVNAVNEKQNALNDFLNSDHALYPYQNYQIIEWLGEVSFTPSPELMHTMRRFTFDVSQPRYLRAVCMKFIEKYGHTSDLERLHHCYRDARNTLEQVEIMCALRRMERLSRNAFLSMAARDGELNRRAEIYARRP